MWDDVTGQPCDDDTYHDAYDWNGDGLHDLNDNRYQNPIRVGTNVLKAGGRHNSIWVIVFLSDGVVNLSDTPETWDQIPAQFIYGFCGNDPANSFWKSGCIDKNEIGEPSEGRHCIDVNPNECPPGATHTTTSAPYSVEDYAYDMIDAAALLYSTNPDEPLGEDIIIYAIGLGAASTTPSGEALLRYMANIGDDGLRANDPCAGAAPLTNCGNYYYAPSAAYLDQIFENIATRIFTKISR